MIPSVLTEAGAARKEHRVDHRASQWFPPSPPQLLHLPGGTHNDLNMRNRNIERI